jgi:hypothetical protein
LGQDAQRQPTPQHSGSTRDHDLHDSFSPQ